MKVNFKILEDQLHSQETTIKELRIANETLQIKLQEEVQVYESKISRLQSEMNKFSENFGAENHGNNLLDELKQAKATVSLFIIHYFSLHSLDI